MLQHLGVVGRTPDILDASKAKAATRAKYWKGDKLSVFEMLLFARHLDAPASSTMVLAQVARTAPGPALPSSVGRSTWRGFMFARRKEITLAGVRVLLR